ncbi:MAG: hypothetical protein ACHP7E_10455, partial [Burkholderiales bacterium]
MKPAKVPRSPRVLILIDYINPLNFPGAEKLAQPALAAARATVRLRERLDAHKVAVVYANDNYGAWTSDFQALVARFAGEMIVLTDSGFHAATGDPENMKICRKGEWNE